MAKSSSLDEFIARKAAEFSDHVRNAAELATTEEEIRIDVENQLAFIKKEAGIDFEQVQGKHEFTVAKGRIDSLYSRVLIEYKNPSDPGACVGPRLDSPGSKKLVEQIKSRFQGLKDEHGHPFQSLFGVGLDGKRFIFVRFRDDKWDVQEPVEVAKHSTERFLWALYNLGQKGKPFSPEYLAGDFGATEGSVAVEGVRALYEAISTTEHPKPETFFKQWKILFGEVCGYDVDHPSDKIKKLAEFYGLPSKGLKPAEMLFALHTYYALFMKLLASEIVAFFHRLPTPLKAMRSAGTGAKLKSEMEKLEAGSIFHHLNITNFLEGDLFAWYIAAWSEPIERLVRRMVAKLDDYNPGTMSENPVVSRDLLKKLYQQLFPKSVRHDLGEYYTPDWLAEHVLNEVGYAGDPDKRLLDPACGSGTFLVMAINRIKAWYEENREKISYDEGELGAKILANVVGFDLNPLAVMAARTNYLVAIRDLVGHLGNVELPVYLCDSIMTPSEYGDLFSGGHGRSKQLKTAAATFYVPTEIATNRSDVAKYAEKLEFGVRNGYSSSEFVDSCRDEGLSIEADSAHIDLFNELVKLDKANKNGVWARIIKNAFAPIFIGRVDYVVGNPPWINWENLPEGYRDDSLPVWVKYGLKSVGAGRSALGKSKHEMAALFLFVCADAYLDVGGKLGFVLTQSLFKNKGAAGFRLLRLKNEYLVPVAVTNLVECGVFEGAVNRTATIVISKGKRPFKFPIPYSGWFPIENPEIPEDSPLHVVKKLVSRMAMDAVPSQEDHPDSPWLTCPEGLSAVLAKVFGTAYFRAFEGVNSGGLVGAYWIQRIRDVGKAHSLVENMWDAGKIECPRVTSQVERPLIYAFLRGRDVRRWVARESALYLMPHDPETHALLPEKEMRRRFPKALEYFGNFKEQLLARKTAPLRQQMARGPFYPVLGAGPNTFAKWKVLFKDLTEFFQCCVVGPADSSVGGKPLLPDCTLRFIPTESGAEAHYIAALLNSSPAVAALYFSSAGVQTQRYHAADAEKLQISRFTGSRAQSELAAISIDCHRAAANGDRPIRELERALDEKAALIWSISKSELKTVQESLDFMSRFVHGGKPPPDAAGAEA